MKTHGVIPLILLLSTCGNPSGSRIKDVATNVSGDKTLSTSYIFYQEGDKVFRAACPAGTVVSDRAHCKLRLESVPATPFFTKLAEAPGLSVPEQEKKVEELYVEIAKTDARLLTMIPQSGDAAKLEQFKADIERLQADVAATAILLGQLDAQISEAQAKLKTTNDPSLADQLLVLQTKRSTLVSKKSEQHNLLNERRRQYVEGQASQELQTEPVYMGVQLQRKSYELKLKKQLEVLHTATVAVASFSQLRSMLNHSDFHFDIQAGEDSFPELRVIAKNMFQVFSDQWFGKINADSIFRSGEIYDHSYYVASIEVNREIPGLRYQLVDDENRRSCDLSSIVASNNTANNGRQFLVDLSACQEMGLNRYNPASTPTRRAHIELSLVDAPDEKVASCSFVIRKPAAMPQPCP